MQNESTESPWTQAPALIFWELTRACDLKCKHCRAEAVPHRNPEELDTEEITSQLRKLGEDMSGVVVFTGGDPFRRPDLAEIIRTCAEVGLKPGLTPSTTPLLTRDRLEELKTSGLKMVALSLDGPDAFRQDDFRGEENSFLHTLRGVRAANAIELPLQINTTICRETYPWLEEIGDVVSRADVFRWALFFLVRTGEGQTLQSITPEETREVFSFLQDWSDENEARVKTTNAPHFRPWRADRTGSSARPGIIDGDGIMFISHRGNVYPSGFLPRKCGNIKNQDILEIYRNHELFQDIRRRELNGRCGRCQHKRSCGGSRANAFAETGDPLGSDPRCNYFSPADGTNGSPRRNPAGSSR